jgi:peroxiredoxin/uncharacterized membrane protein YphA (DoxX/SURF4 family)
MHLLLLSGRILLAIVFASASAAKAFDARGSQKALSDFGLPQPFVRPAAFLLPVAELATAILLFSARAAFCGAASALALLLAFLVVIIANLLKGRRPECHCFGQFHPRPISWALVTRNVTLVIVAAAILWEGPGMSTAAAARRFAQIATAQPLPVAAVSLAAAGLIVQTFFLLALFQQHGRLMLRMDRLEQSAAAFAPTRPAVAGLPLGARAPSFELSSDNGPNVLGRLLLGGKPVVLVFTDPDCQACAGLLPDIERWEHQFGEMVTFVVISRTPPSGNGGASAKQLFRNMAWQKNREVSESYKVGGIPAAVLVRPDATIGSWLATGRPAIQTLITLLLYRQMLVATNELVS